MRVLHSGPQPDMALVGWMAELSCLAFMASDGFFFGGKTHRFKRVLPFAAGDEPQAARRIASGEAALLVPEAPNYPHVDCLLGVADAKDVRQARGGNPISAKLRQTAVNVLTGRSHSSAGRWEKEAESVVATIAAEAPDQDAFQRKHEELRSNRTPKLDEFLVTLQSMLTNADVRAALASTPGAGGSSAKPDSARATQSTYRNPMFNQDDAVTPLKPAYSSLSAKGAQSVDVGAPAASQVNLPPVDDVFRPSAHALGDMIIPLMPDWNSARPFLTGDFISQVSKPHEGRQAELARLQSLSPSLQEAAVVDDLLYAFLGLHGTYVAACVSEGRGGQQLQYVVEGQLEPALQELATRLLPMCEHVVVVERFVETRSAFGWGLVCQAVAASMRSLLQDWQLMVTQLEHQMLIGRLTLQVLWFYCQLPLASMQLLASIAQEASQQRLRGSALLNLLHSWAARVAGDAAARRLVHKLLQAACCPYFRSLERWLCEGVVDDPYSEFMVQENKAVSKDSLSEDEQSAYWYHRYTLRPAEAASKAGRSTGSAAADPPHDVPIFLEGSKTTILTTGKYLNAIRECGRPVVRPLAADVHIEYDAGEAYVAHIEACFRAASAALLGLLQRELGLGDTLAALKHYFLLDRGDLLISFMDTAEEELAKPATDVSVARLQALLELAVRTSSASSDPTSEDLMCTLDHRSLLGMLKHIFQHREEPHRLSPLKGAVPASTSPSAADRNLLKSRLGREALMLGYKVEWPISVVVSQQAMTQYQLIFRHLFELKYVEHALNNIWRIFQTSRALFRQSQAVLKRSYGLCQQMMHFFHQYLLYVTFEVMEPLWHTMQTHIKAATTLDQVMAAHKEFLRRVLKGCLLSRKVKLLRNLMDLKALALRFADTAARIAAEVDAVQAAASQAPASPGESEHAGRSRKAAAVAEAVRATVESAGFGRSIQELEASFNAKFKDFITGLEDIHKTAQTDKTESRDELDSLLNLISRLDFNDYFKGKADFRAMLAHE
ncbi:hypothetical protein WJX72_005158 [[Myrmecia] bisecta]|uniref:Gamma-tubulin complex component n=1 Tax=[Myrmecia] bisecta TaxID=41462 RepID=A0AAW1Q7D6_9CHLO